MGCEKRIWAQTLLRVRKFLATYSARGEPNICEKKKQHFQ